MNPPSIKRALIVRCGIGVGALLCLLCAGCYLLVRQNLYQELDESISQTAALLGNQVELENEAITFEWQEGLGTNKSIIADGLFQFWDESSSASTRSPGLHFRDLPRFSGIDGRPLLRNIILPDGHRGRAIGLRIYPFVLQGEIERMRERGRMIDPKTLPHILVVARDAEPMHHMLDRLRWILTAGTLVTLGIGFLLIHLVVRVALRPIDDLTKQMKDRSEHQLDNALDLPGALPSELTGLAENFDSLLSRVAAIRQREKDFIRHAAHELRTPIAGLRATTDLALSQHRDAAAYAAHLATCQKTAIELGELVKRLSALSRIGQTLAPPSRSPLDVPALLAESIGNFTPLFDERGLVMKTAFPADKTFASADTPLLRIIFNNLCDNIVSYATGNTEVRVQVLTEGTAVIVRISNETENLPEHPSRLFEPLFRRDTSRTDAGAHLGIGLTLSQEAAQAMEATLVANVTPDKRIEFVLTLPAHPC